MEEQVLVSPSEICHAMQKRHMKYAKYVLGITQKSENNHSTTICNVNGSG